jgi:hypothetical protein
MQESILSIKNMLEEYAQLDFYLVRYHQLEGEKKSPTHHIVYGKIVKVV